MSREIKFRAWDKVRKEFLSGGKVLISIEPGKRPKSSPIYLDILTNPDSYRDRFIIQQYTGLKDKNGVEIYEGDVVTVLREDSCKPYRSHVYFTCGCFGTSWPNPIEKVKSFVSLFDWDVEVIGNIHDNPELLEDKP